MNKKKIIIAVILLLLIIGIALFFAFRNNKTVLTVSYEVNGEIINDPVDSSGAHRTRYIATSFILTKE